MEKKKNISYQSHYLFCTYKFLYSGFGIVPPEYPTFVRTTPFVAPNNASAPQKHPIPNVAVS